MKCVVKTSHFTELISNILIQHAAINQTAFGWLV